MMSDSNHFQKVYNEYCLHAKQAKCVDFLNQLIHEKQIESFCNYMEKSHQTTLMTHAIETNQIEVVNFLLEKKLVKLNYTDSLLHNYLHLSALNQNFNIFKTLFPHVQLHFDINYKNCFGFTYLHYASCYKKEIFYFLLIQPNIDIYTRNINDKTVLTYLCHFGNDEMISYLLTHYPFDLTHLDDEGKNYWQWCHKESTKNILNTIKEKDELTYKFGLKTHLKNLNLNKIKL